MSKSKKELISEERKSDQTIEVKSGLITTEDIESLKEPGKIEEMPRITDHGSYKIYVLMWYQPIAHDSKIIWPGDEVEESIVKKMPPYLKQHFWEKGTEIPERTYNKLSKNLQEKFKVKK